MAITVLPQEGEVTIQNAAHMGRQRGGTEACPKCMATFMVVEHVILRVEGNFVPAYTRFRCIDCGTLRPYTEQPELSVDAPPPAPKEKAKG